MAAPKVPALLLPSSAAAGVEPVTFPGFPGRFVPGEPVELGVLAGAAGVTPDELLATVADLELPLEHVKVGAGSGSLPDRDNHAADAPPAFDLVEPVGDEPAVEPDLEEASV